MTRPIDVTVIIPAWDVHAERFLDAALASVLAQSVRPDVVISASRA